MRVKLLLLLPMLLLLALFVASNTDTVSIGLWPTGWAVPMPLAAALLLSMAVAFLLGAVLVWFGGLSVRRRARRAEARIAVLQTELQSVRGRATTL